ncbi:hypothetical protein NE848_04245 [Gramella jeungdoensis]|uniref:Uncharacterized protein n=1 Tax=Gramella jeungdoensis TaxID=708091 RepID=A0ABT0YZX6_9FLAO|nr:hypothetical protein [Gramella jeungdoensis]MCM8568575.1 hypothetical protein [Gramella jeungdoensis]
MEEIKAVLSSISFWFYEKYRLRKFQGVSRPGHIEDSKRNEEFYRKLEKHMLPFLEKRNFSKLKKRIFICEKPRSVSYIHFALNNQLNGLVVDYGDIFLENKTRQELLDRIKYDSGSKRLKPDFWKYDYNYPVRKTKRFDEALIKEIEELIKEKIE